MDESIKVREFSLGDIKDALRLTRAEGWTSGIKEYYHTLSVNPDGCFALAKENQFIGGITTYIYTQSAWVGNFIVSPEYRNQGFGGQLLGQALKYLHERDLATIYLTAAPKAVNLYKRHGFQEVCIINRWRKDIQPGDSQLDGLAAKKSTLERIVDFDQHCWNEDRSLLISSLWSRRSSLEHKKPYGFLMYSKVNKYKVIGPWEVAGNDIMVAEKLLNGVYASAKKKEAVLLDVPILNRAASSLLFHHGFNIAGSSTFMFYGKRSVINFEDIFSLGSLGSIG